MSAAPTFAGERTRGRMVSDAIRGACTPYARRPDPNAAGIAVTSFAEFVQTRNPTLLRYEHVARLCAVAERIVSGELPRVLVILPPRYFKSEIFSRLLPAYFLRRHPTLLAGVVSYGADLAWSLSEDARNYFLASGGIMSRDASAKKNWRTAAGGKMWAAGAGGPLLGFGYHLGVVDDPVDPDQARSPIFQRRFREWWPAKFLSRQEPNARIGVVMQRLGLDDPIDFLFRREVGENTELAPEHWHVVVCDEIKSSEPLGRWDGPMGLPPTCTIEPDTRNKGTLLAPSRFNAAQVAGIQSASGALVTSSQRQGRPMRASGDFWKFAWFRTYDTLPANAYDGGKDWDTAYTKEEANSASAYVESYRGPGKDGQFPIYIEDAGWDWREFPELITWIRSLTGPHYVEQKASGKSIVQALAMEQILAHEVTVLGDKLARASSVQPVVSNGRIFVRRDLAHSLLYGERQGLLRVTAEQLQVNGSDLDLNDAYVQAITRHVGLHQSRVAFGFGR